MLDTKLVWMKLREAEAFACQVGAKENFYGRLRYLDRYAEQMDDDDEGRPVYDRGRSRCVLYPDFAPYSFGFGLSKRDASGQYRQMLSGGLIYHGPGLGGPIAPNLSVRVGDGYDVHDWGIHT